MVMREALGGYEGGLTGGRKISNQKYVDDVVLLATSTQELHVLVDCLNIVSKKYGLLINTDETWEDRCDSFAESEKAEQAHTLQYPGTLISDDRLHKNVHQESTGWFTGHTLVFYSPRGRHYSSRPAHC